MSWPPYSFLQSSWILGLVEFLSLRRHKIVLKEWSLQGRKMKIKKSMIRIIQRDYKIMKTKYDSGMMIKNRDYCNRLRPTIRRDKLGLSCAKLKLSQKLQLKLNLELKLKLVTTSPGGQWWVGGQWDKKEFQSTKIEAPQKLGPKSLVKIRSVRSDILLIWKNVPRRNVAWTNVNVTAGTCSRCSQVPTFKVWSKLGQ